MRRGDGGWKGRGGWRVEEAVGGWGGGWLKGEKVHILTGDQQILQLIFSANNFMDDVVPHQSTAK